MKDLFKKLPGKFIQYWGFTWLFSTASCLCVLLTQMSMDGFAVFALLKKAFDMYALLFLIFAAYYFTRESAAAFWLRYSFILLLMAVVMLQYELPTLIALLPISAYQGILTVALCYTAAVKWTVHPAEKALALTIFLLFGTIKMLSPYQLEIFYVCEMFISLLLNFYIMFLFLAKIYRDFLMEENVFQVIGENTADILFDYRFIPEPYFSYVSPAVETLTGYPQKEFYKNSNLFEELTAPSDREALRGLFQAHGQEILIVQWQKKDGDYIWVEFHNSPHYDGDELLSIEGVIRDITEWKLAEEELIQSRQAKQILFSYISHELMTPVTSILGYAKALESNVIEDAEKHGEAVSLIVSKSIVLKRLIDDLLQLSKLESNQFSFQFAEVPVAVFFEEIIRKQKKVIEAGGLCLNHSISRRVTEKNRTFIIDVERMEQVFDNLIGNAIKFTPKNGEIRIFCGLDSTRKKAVFEVRDTGMGISAKSLPFIFETYYKDKRTSEVNPDGSGLGLSIAREIVKGHQGDIFAESKEDKGSRFIIIVPLYARGD